MSISLCAIVKDEAKVIEGMLASVEGLVDEIVIVDTGSTDATVQVASAHGANVQHFEWCNDYAAARNFSVSFAKSDWILVLDADERLELSHHEKVLEAVRNEKNAYFLQRLHYQKREDFHYFEKISEGDYYSALGAVGYYKTRDLRLYPNIDEIVFEGALHESPEDSMRRANRFQLVNSDIRIHHIGALLDEELLALKIQRYVLLAEAKLRADDSDWRNWFQLGAECQSARLNEKAVMCFSKAAELMPEMAMCWRQLGISLVVVEDYTGGVRALSRASEIDGSCVITWNALGVCLMKIGFYKESRICFETALSIDPNGFLPKSNLIKLASLESNK